MRQLANLKCRMSRCDPNVFNWNAAIGVFARLGRRSGHLACICYGIFSGNCCVGSRMGHSDRFRGNRKTEQELSRMAYVHAQRRGRGRSSLLPVRSCAWAASIDGSGRREHGPCIPSVLHGRGSIRVRSFISALVSRVSQEAFPWSLRPGGPASLTPRRWHDGTLHSKREQGIHPL